MVSGTLGRQVGPGMAVPGAFGHQVGSGTAVLGALGRHWLVRGLLAAVYWRLGGCWRQAIGALGARIYKNRKLLEQALLSIYLV